MQKVDLTPHVYSVYELTRAIKGLLEEKFFFVIVEGEVSNVKLQSSGHLYFSLKDTYSQVSCVMFREGASKLKTPLNTGDKIVVRAQLSVYPPRGAYQLIVKDLSPLGLGELLIKLEQLKAKLKSRGWFDEAYKKKLPRFPKKIGVVTSLTGAVIHDIITILERRLGSFHLIINPVRVQGEGAADEIAQAIGQFNQHSLVDVMIVGRGGGSLEDLMPFNDEKVAQAIFESRIPIISAVGHETDFSISDFVADVRAPTPSAAAEIVSQQAFEVKEKLHQMALFCERFTKGMVQTLGQLLKSLERHPLFAAPRNLIIPLMQQLDSLNEAIDSAMKKRLESAKQSLTHAYKTLSILHPQVQIEQQKSALLQQKKALFFSISRLMAEKKALFTGRRFESSFDSLLQKLHFSKKQNFEKLSCHIESLNPKSILQKGYTIVFSQKEGKAISSIKAVSQGEAVRIAFADGDAEAQIQKTYDRTKSLF